MRVARQGGHQDRVVKVSSHSRTSSRVDTSNGPGQEMCVGGRHLVVENGSSFAEGLGEAVLVGLRKLEQVPWLGWKEANDKGCRGVGSLGRLVECQCFGDDGPPAVASAVVA